MILDTLDNLTFDQLHKNHDEFKQSIVLYQEQIGWAREAAQEAAQEATFDNLIPGMDQAFESAADYNTKERDLCHATVAEYEKEIETR